MPPADSLCLLMVLVVGEGRFCCWFCMVGVMVVVACFVCCSNAGRGCWGGGGDDGVQGGRKGHCVDADLMMMNIDDDDICQQ